MLSLLTDDEVGDGEGEEEVVGDGLQLLVHLEADHHLWRGWRVIRGTHLRNDRGPDKRRGFVLQNGEYQC